MFNYLSNQSAKGAMTAVATRFRYTTRTKWLIPRLREATATMYIPANPTCSRIMARYGFTSFRTFPTPILFCLMIEC